MRRLKTVCGQRLKGPCGVRRALQDSCPLPALPRSAGEGIEKKSLNICSPSAHCAKSIKLREQCLRFARDQNLERRGKESPNACCPSAHCSEKESTDLLSGSRVRFPPSQCGGGLGRGQSCLSAIPYPLSASKSSGMSLVAALFLIVVIAALGAFAVRIGMGQQHTVNLSLLSNRAMAAANAGIEWSAYRALESGNCSNGSLSLTQGALAGFTVDVSCVSTSFGTEGTLYVIESVSRYGTYGRADYASRRVRARFFE